MLSFAVPVISPSCLCRPRFTRALVNARAITLACRLCHRLRLRLAAPTTTALVLPASTPAPAPSLTSMRALAHGLCHVAAAHASLSLAATTTAALVSLVPCLRPPSLPPPPSPRPCQHPHNRDVMVMRPRPRLQQQVLSV